MRRKSNLLNLVTKEKVAMLETHAVDHGAEGEGAAIFRGEGGGKGKVRIGKEYSAMNRTKKVSGEKRKVKDERMV